MVSGWPPHWHCTAASRTGMPFEATGANRQRDDDALDVADCLEEIDAPFEQVRGLWDDCCRHFHPRMAAGFLPRVITIGRILPLPIGFSSVCQDWLRLFHAWTRLFGEKPLMVRCEGCFVIPTGESDGKRVGIRALCFTSIRLY